MIAFEELERDLSGTPIENWHKFLLDAIKRKFSSYTHGELNHWKELLENLPELSTQTIDLVNKVSIGTKEELDSQLSKEEIDNFVAELKKLHPWRKGPFDLFGIHIDTEWRSDWKWQRVLPHLADLNGRTVLDVGCGNGYHCWRILGAGAKLVVGIDPSQKFLAQFNILKKYLKKQPVHLLPLGIEDMPDDMQNDGFDTVFSMGVFYHRKSPIQHLIELKNLMAPKGELVLETLVIDGNENQVLVPEDRYAQMRNVWFLPSVSALELWLKRSGFKNIRTVDINQTSLEEQRSTEWMQFHSLVNYLDPNDISKTVEGYPAPKRATVIANKN